MFSVAEFNRRTVASAKAAARLYFEPLSILTHRQVQAPSDDSAPPHGFRRLARLARAAPKGTAQLVQPSFWRQVWKDIEPSARAMVGDAALFMLGIIVLALSFLGLLGLASLHYPTKYIDILETLHFWGYFAVLAVLLLDLLSKVASHAFWRE